MVPGTIGLLRRRMATTPATLIHRANNVIDIASKPAAIYDQRSGDVLKIKVAEQRRQRDQDGRDLKEVHHRGRIAICF